MWDDCYEGKSLLSPASTSKLGLSISDVITDWLKSLPEELIPDILIRLPIKSLIRFTSVCKPWMSTIKDPTFVRNFSDQNATHLILLHVVQSEGYFNPEGTIQIIGFQEDSYSLLHDDTAVSEYCKVEFPIALNEELINPCFRVVGTCNGLVLLADDLGDYGYTFVLWNPSIRKYVTLPKPSVWFSTHGRYDASLGLGYDAISNDYKVVRLTTLFDQSDDCLTKAQVYSLGEGSWKMLLPVPVPQCFVSDSLVHVFVNGSLHWMAIQWTEIYMNYFILTFDVAGESFGERLLPKSFKLDEPLDLRLSVSGDRKSIALFVRCKRDSFLDVWVMKEYSEEKSWTKVVVLGPQGPERSLPMAFCFKRSGEVILELSHELVSLDVVSKGFKRLGISGGHICYVDSFEESLVLLDRDDAASY
uniref:F-box/kelch-repeat protein At3g23880-like isoform X2 n=1 Tax=Fragaria vesca subsp. vesca TaxID=101020 RepID=UPI0005CB12C9|nr:PREDICTED: F-box/kelch-repeat protein At3g23880-like isoform X2 [Fragaria vesca subsp. vesca]